MSNLKALKIRIASIKSTIKITSAMKMVAAAKLRKAKKQEEESRAFAKKISETISHLSSNALSEQDFNSKLLSGNGKNQAHLIIIAASDRGLCGPFNNSIFKEAKILIAELESENKQFKLLCIGKKAYEAFKTKYENQIILHIDDLSKKKISYIDADTIAQRLINEFKNDQFDVCTIIYNKFISSLVQKVTLKQLIPSNIKQSNLPVEVKENYEYEPKESVILDKLLPLNLAAQIYQILLENSASEHGARMSAMDGATNNANKMMKELTLKYNRTRQAVITKELIEIISGAEAV